MARLGDTAEAELDGGATGGRPTLESYTDMPPVVQGKTCALRVAGMLLITNGHAATFLIFSSRFVHSKMGSYGEVSQPDRDILNCRSALLSVAH